MQVGLWLPRPVGYDFAPMKTIIISLLTVVTLTASSFAGTSYAKNTKNPIAPAPTGCDCFGPGFSFGLYGGGFIPPHEHESELGGGAILEYFFNDWIGIQGTYGIYATNAEHHQFDGSLVLRYPIRSICIAPYAIVGGGGSTNSDRSGDWHVGGGIDARIPSSNCLGIFADGAYHFAEEGQQDFTIVRLGVKFKF